MGWSRIGAVSVVRGTERLKELVRRRSSCGGLRSTRGGTSTSVRLRHLVNRFGLGEVSVGGRTSGGRESRRGLSGLGARVERTCSRVVSGRGVVTCGSTGTTFSIITGEILTVIRRSTRNTSPRATSCDRSSYSNDYTAYNNYN